MTKRPCPVCGGKVAAVLHSFSVVTPSDYCLPGQYDIVSCEQCGMVYADMAATQADYDRFYTEQNKYPTRYEPFPPSSGAIPLDA